MPTIIGNDLRNTIFGGSGDDTLFGRGADDQLQGQGGNDFLYGGDGNDILMGGDGNDLVYGDDEGSPIGNDILFGDDGNDVLFGGTGTNTLVGGLGADAFVVENANDDVVELRDQGKDRVYAYVDYVLSNSSWVEELYLSGEARNGTGNNIDNVIRGNGYDNVLIGNKGDDVLNGLDGDDTLVGGLGNDIYYVDSALDVVTEARGEGEDTVYASVNYALTNTSWVDDLVLIEGSEARGAIGNDIFNTITGNTLNNFLNGLGGNDTLYGRDGNDTLIGGTGKDQMIGGAGDDIYYVDNKDDYAVEANGEGNDIVRASVSYSLSNSQYVETLILDGRQDLNARGNNIDNVIVGNTGNNVIEGRRGGDIMTGGGGDDTFVWTATNESFGSNTDRITDLSSKGDTLDLSAIDADLGLAGDQDFVLTSAFTNQAGQMVFSYNAGADMTTLLLDVNGDSTADMRILFNGDQTGHTNFVF